VIPIVPWHPGHEPERLTRLLRRFAGPPPDVTREALATIRRLEEGGASALAEVRAEAGDTGPLRIPREQLSRLVDGLDPQLLSALEGLADALRRYHERPPPPPRRYEDGRGGLIVERVRPLARVGIFVAGDSVASATAVLMGAVPAAACGVEQIVATVSSDALAASPAVAAALQIAGVDEVFALRGAAAVGALALGIDPVPAVDLIVGGGDHEAVAAKRLVLGRVGIPRFSGPPELVVLADGHGLASWVAADLLGVAERDPSAMPVAIVQHAEFAIEVAERLEAQLAATPDRATAEAALDKHGAIFVTESAESACRLTDLLAPEQASLQVGHPDDIARNLHHVGVILLGVHTPESVRYAAGFNHDLPTGGTARFASIPGPAEFFKRSVEVQFSAARLAASSEAIGALARAEGFELSGLAAQARKQLADD